jgi:hypothetical protein
MPTSSPSSEPRDENWQQSPPPAVGERMPAHPDSGFRPAVVVASVCLWIAYLAIDAVAGIGFFLSLPSMAVTPQAIGALVGALVFDVVMLVFTLVMRRGYNWARIVLAVFGSLRLLFLLFALIAGAANAVTAVLLLLLVAAIVIMFLPVANAWFALSGQAGQRPGPGRPGVQ